MTAEPLIDQKQKALQAFNRDLPNLWRERPGQWVAYHGGRQVAFAARKHELYNECFQRGLTQGDFVIFCIEAQEDAITLGPVILEQG